MQLGSWDLAKCLAPLRCSEAGIVDGGMGSPGKVQQRHARGSSGNTSSIPFHKGDEIRSGSWSLLCWLEGI